MKRKIILFNTWEKEKEKLYNLKFIFIANESLKYLCLRRLAQQGFCIMVIQKAETKPKSLSNRPSTGRQVWHFLCYAAGVFKTSLLFV